MWHVKLPGLALSLLICAGAAGQTGSGTQHLLWFKGHWNKNKKGEFIIEGLADSSLAGLTPGGIAGTPGKPGGASPGGTITVDPDGSLHPHTGAVDSWNKWVDDALHSEDNLLQVLNDPKENLEPATHQLYQLFLPDAEERKQQLQNYKIDPAQDMLTGQKPDPSKATPARTVNDVVGDYCKQVRADYDEVMSFYKTQIKKHENDLKIPPPPAFEYSCYACDPDLRKSYDTTTEHYVRDFMHPEDSIIRKGLHIIRDLAIAGVTADEGIDRDIYDALFKIDKKDPSGSGPCSYIDVGELYHAVYETAFHLYMRADKLVRTNKGNFKAAKAILSTYLGVVRDWELFSGQEVFKYKQAELGSLLNDNIHFYVDKFHRNDWRTIGNLPFILGLYKDYDMVTGGGDSNFQEFLRMMQKTLNGFKLSIEMDIKIGKNGGYHLAHLKGDCHIQPYFLQDSNQCYKWVVANENSLNGLGLYEPKTTPTIDCQLIDNEIITPPGAPRPLYIGTRKYTAELISLSMDFCNPGHDTILLTGFTPNPRSAGTFQIPQAPPANMGVGGLESFFEDVMAKKRLAEDGEARQAADDLKEQGEALKKQADALKAQMGGAQGGVNYEKMRELALKARGMTTNATTGQLMYIDFLLPVENNSTVLVNKVYDAREINPELAKTIVYGRYTVHIENNGNGPTKNPSLKK